MAISQVVISVCNDGNVSQLDCTDTVNGGVYYRIEVYRSSQPSGGLGVTFSGSRLKISAGWITSNQTVTARFGIFSL
jgi:hypothetical protein